MADTTTRNNLQLAKNANETSHLIVDGKKYALDASGVFTHTPSFGGKTSTLEGEKLLQALKDGLEKAAKSSSLSAEQFGQLQKFAESLKNHPDYASFLDAHNVVAGIDATHSFSGKIADYSAAAEEVTKAKEALSKAAPADKAAVQTAVEAAEREVANLKSDVLKLLSKDTAHSTIPKAQMDAFKKALGDKGWDKLQTTVKDAKALTKEIAGASFNTDADKAANELRKILAKHHKAESGGITVLSDLMGDEAHAKLSKIEDFDVHGIISSFAEEVESAEKQLKSFAARTAELKKAVADAPPSGKQAALDALKEHADEVKDFFESEEHAAARGAAFRDAPTSIRSTLNAEETIKSAASKASSGLGKAAGSAANEVQQTGKWYSLFHGEEKQAAKLAEQNKTLVAAGKAEIKELGFFSKLRPGKTALVVGAGAIGAYALATIGNKGPGEKAAAVQAGRDQEPAVGRA